MESIFKFKCPGYLDSYPGYLGPWIHKEPKGILGLCHLPPQMVDYGDMEKTSCEEKNHEGVVEVTIVSIRLSWSGRQGNWDYFSFQSKILLS